MSLNQQSWLWTALYAFLVLLVVGCALTVPGDAVEYAPEEESAPPTTRQILHWIVLAAVPSGLMLSTTTHLTTDIVAMPLLWVMPLGIYLLSFVIAFAERRRPTELVTILAPLIILIAGGLAFSDGSRNPFVSATLGLVLLLVVAVALHGEMFRLRPAVGQLTKFYLAMSFGGMLGGLFCAIVAPLIFDWAYEHPILILAAALLVPQSPLVPWPERAKYLFGAAIPALAILISLVSERGWFGISPGVAMMGSIIVSLLALACLGRRVPFMVALAALMLSYGGWTTLARSATDGRTRSYFGIYDVYDRRPPLPPARVLTHGTTLHGIQNLTPGLETVPTSYYARRSGVGLTLTNANAIVGRPARIGFVGLGTGTLSCYRQAGQHWTIYEIDPQMVEVARNRFSFLSRCAPDAQVVLGDARISLRDRTPANSLDILAVDAFTSDAVPMHLLTREALAEYGRAVQRDGIVLFHISNRYLDLKPVVADLAASGGWASAMMIYQPTEEEADLNATTSVWIALSRNPQTLQRLIALSGEDGPNWEALDPTPGFAGWTDDHASILPILNYPSWVPFVGRR